MKRAAALATLAALAIFGVAQPSLAQTDDLKELRKDVDSLKESQKSIQSDLQEIKTLLRSRPAAGAPPLQEAVINVEGARFKGDKNAKITMVDFTDYQ